MSKLNDFCGKDEGCVFTVMNVYKTNEKLITQAMPELFFYLHLYFFIFTHIHFIYHCYYFIPFSIVYNYRSEIHFVMWLLLLWEGFLTLVILITIY